MNSETTYRGYRVLGDRKPDKQYDTSSLMLKPEASQALRELWTDPNPANCLNREEEFRGDNLPTDAEAQLMCAGCPRFEKCEIYRKVAHPAWGVYAGTVQGRALEEIEREERENAGSS